jgi:hypothetical protein
MRVEHRAPTILIAFLFGAVGCGSEDSEGGDPMTDPTAMPTTTTTSTNTANPTSTTTTTSPIDMPPPNEPTSLRGTCAGFTTEFDGDEACMEAPPPELGFQIHIGPNDHDNPDEVSVFLMQPGGESSECYMKATPNDGDIFYNMWELSGRPGTHHIINTLLGTPRTEGWGGCEQFVGGGDVIGSMGGASRTHMPLHDMHYFNTTDGPILREFWMNVWYIDAAEVTETPGRIMGLGGIGWNIPAGTHDTYRYASPPTATDGRIIQLLGHTHAHGIRETAWIQTGTEMTKVFEQYDYLEPQIFNFNTVEQNPSFSTTAPGAHSGMLQVPAGSSLVWECEILNDSSVSLTYVNAVDTGEMCNIWGATVGMGPISAYGFGNGI